MSAAGFAGIAASGRGRRLSVGGEVSPHLSIRVRLSSSSTRLGFTQITCHSSLVTRHSSLDWCRRRESNPHAREERGILSPLRLPFRHSGSARILFGFFLSGEVNRGEGRKRPESVGCTMDAGSRSPANPF